jgi:hypothetical protein
MEAADDTIVRHYQAHHEEARISEGFGQLELLRAQEVLRRHLPRPPAKVLDVGGTGVHARWLAAAGETWTTGRPSCGRREQSSPNRPLPV